MLQQGWKIGVAIAAAVGAAYSTWKNRKKIKRFGRKVKERVRNTKSTNPPEYTELNIAILGMRATGKSTFWDILLGKPEEDILRVDRSVSSGEPIEEQKISIEGEPFILKKSNDYAGEKEHWNEIIKSGKITEKDFILFFIKSTGDDTHENYWCDVNSRLTDLKDKGIPSENIYLIFTFSDELSKECESPEKRKIKMDEILKKVERFEKMQRFINTRDIKSVKEIHIPEICNRAKQRQEKERRQRRSEAAKEASNDQQTNNRL